MKKKIIREPDSNESHRAWRKAQKKCGVKTGDVDIGFSSSIDRMIRNKGLTSKEITDRAIIYYRIRGECKKIK